MKAVKINLLGIFGLLILLSSCGVDDSNMEYSDPEKQAVCMNYDFSRDTLQLTSLEYLGEDNVTRYVSIAEPGVNLLGHIFFKDDQFNLWIRARDIIDTDTLFFEYKIEGSYTSEVDTMIEHFIAGDYPVYTRYNDLALFFDQEEIHLTQRIDCRRPTNQRWYSFKLDSRICELFFNPFPE